MPFGTVTNKKHGAGGGGAVVTGFVLDGGDVVGEFVDTGGAPAAATGR